MNKNAPITLRITPNVKFKLVELANREDRSVSAIIRRAVSEYIKKSEVALYDKVSVGDRVNIDS